MLIAVTRPVSASIAQCELTHLRREPIDAARAGGQHAAYQRLLQSLGATVVEAPAAPELPDAVFIEDTALVLDEVAVITRPGAASRRAETGPVADLLREYRPLACLTAPATLDGGDVLPLGHSLYVGISSRTNLQGVEQLRAILTPLGYYVVPIEVAGCLHLKSAVTVIADRLLLLNPRWVPARAFADCDALAVDDAEEAGANALLIDGTVIYPAHFPRTSERLAKRGLRVATVEYSELAKAEGGVTCCSLVFQAT